MTATDSICLSLELERQYQIPEATTAARTKISAASQYFLLKASVVSATTAIEAEEESAVATTGVAAEEDCELRGRTGLGDCGWIVVALIGVELLPESISRFRRF